MRQFCMKSLMSSFLCNRSSQLIVSNWKTIDDRRNSDVFSLLSYSSDRLNKHTNKKGILKLKFQLFFPDLDSGSSSESISGGAQNFQYSTQITRCNMVKRTYYLASFLLRKAIRPQITTGTPAVLAHKRPYHYRVLT